MTHGRPAPRAFIRTVFLCMAFGLGPQLMAMHTVGREPPRDLGFPKRIEHQDSYTSRSPVQLSANLALSENAACSASGHPHPVQLRRPRNAELHSAVSQNCILQGVSRSETSRQARSPADCKSAIQQSATLRYGVGFLTASVSGGGEIAPVASGDTEKTSSEVIRVLLVTGIDHPAHDWRQTTPALREELTKDRRMRVEVLEDPYRLELVNLSDFQVVFLHFNNWEKPDPSARAKENLQNFVQTGGGLFILHFACGAFPNWAEFPALAGKVWDRKNTHDPRGPFRVNIVNTQHPVTHRMEAFDTDDELYTCLAGDKPVEVLATARSKVTKQDHPMAFAHLYGKGRVFHTPLGHDARAIRSAGASELIRRGCAWAAGRDPLPVLPAAKGERSEITPERSSDALSRQVESQFELSPGFEIQLVAAEPDIANPMTLCVDQSGALYVTEAHTYRWGPPGSPFQPPTNPIKRIDLGPDGRVTRSTVVASGFPEPAMGVHARDDKLYVTCLNELFVMDILSGGALANRKLLVKDAATPWNPFGMYRVQVGPDDKLWLCIADHPSSQPVELTGSDGRKIKFQGKTGGMVRCNRDGSGLEIVVQGFRAPYAFDIDPWGHLWHISNGEGSPNLYIHVIYGMDYGYQSRKVSYAWLAGVEPLSPPVRDMGAGANTAALHYYSSMFPQEFWGNIFVSNWGSHGSAPANRDLTRWLRQRSNEQRLGTSDDELLNGGTFLKTVDPMFRPTQVVLAPDGGLYLLDWHGKDDENDKTGRILKIAYRGANAARRSPSPTAQEIQSMTPGELAGLLGHANHLVREQCIRHLVKAGTAALDPLARVLETGSAFAAAHAVWTLTRLRTADATEVLTRGLKHPDARVRAHVLRQLRQAAGQELGTLRGGQMSHPNVPEDRSSQVGVGTTLSRETLAKLAAPLSHDPDAEVRVEAALAQDSRARVSDGLIAATQAPGNRRLRYQIGMELSRRGDRAAVEQLIQSNDSEIQRVGRIALDIARYEKTPLASSADDLERSLQTRKPAESLSQHFESLLKRKPEEIEVELAKLDRGEVRLSTQSDKLAALAVIESLAPKVPPSKFLLAALHDSEPCIQEAALRAVRQCASDDPELMKAAMRIARAAPSKDTQLEALFTLGLLGVEAPADEWLRRVKNPSKDIAIPAWRALRLRERSPELRKAIPQAIRDVVGRDADLDAEMELTLRFIGFPARELEGLRLKAPAPRSKGELSAAVLSRLPKASATLGRLSFTTSKAVCTQCHSVWPGDSKYGPSLADVGAASQPAYFVESILEPSRVIKTGYLNESVETRDGRVFTGLVEASGETLIVRMSATEKAIVGLNEVKRRVPSEVSAMPEGLETTMSEQELADVVAYLVTLKHAIAPVQLSSPK